MKKNINDKIIASNCNANKNVKFETEKFKKLEIKENQGYRKNTLTLNLPFELILKDGYMYNEEDDFDKLLKYLNDIEILNINMKDVIVDKIIEIIYTIEKQINKRIKVVNIVTENKTIKNVEKLRCLEDNRIITYSFKSGTIFLATSTSP